MQSPFGIPVCPICGWVVGILCEKPKFWECNNPKCVYVEWDHDIFELAFTNEDNLIELHQKRELELDIEEIRKKIVTLLQAEILGVGYCPLCGQMVGFTDQMQWTCKNKECPNSVRKRDWVDLIKGPKDVVKEVNQNDENSN